MAEDRANGLTQQIFSQKQPLVSVIIPCYNAEKYELWCRLVFEKGVKGANLGETLFEYEKLSNVVD